MARRRAVLIGGAALAAVAILSLWRLQDPVAPVFPVAVEATSPSSAPDATTVEPEVTAAPEKKAPASPRLDVVRVERDGEAVFAGSVQPDADVQIRIGEEVIASTRAGRDGKFVTYGKVPPTEGLQRLDLWETGEGGDVARSDAPVLVAPPRADPPDAEPAAADAAPDAPPIVVQAQPEGVKVLQAPPRPADRPVTLDLVSYTSEGWLEISGRAEALRMLRVYANAKLIAETWVAADGSWSTRATAGLAPGTYTLRVDMLGDDGAVRGRVESPFRREAVEAVALAQGEIVVQPGDTLWAIAENRYGTGVRYSVIYQANAARIRDPDLIYPGQIFNLPDSGAPR